VRGQQRDLIRTAILNDQVIAIPSQGGYALAARSSGRAAPEKFSSLAARHCQGQELTRLVGEQSQAKVLAADWGVVAQRLTERMWPGPLTVMVPGVDAAMVRIGMPIRKPLRALCAETGPWLSSMLCRDGSALSNVNDVIRVCVGSEVALVVDGGVCAGPEATVVDCSHEVPVVVQEGALPESYVDGVMAMGAWRRRRWFFGPRT
jgi:L-threonylcarbamoyladenylate synthase